MSQWSCIGTIDKDKDILNYFFKGQLEISNWAND